jgi:hypothetical protein
MMSVGQAGYKGNTPSNRQQTIRPHANFFSPFLALAHRRPPASILRLRISNLILDLVEKIAEYARANCASWLLKRGCPAVFDHFADVPVTY